MAIGKTTFDARRAAIKKERARLRAELRAAMEIADERRAALEALSACEGDLIAEFTGAT